MRKGIKFIIIILFIFLILPFHQLSYLNNQGLLKPSSINYMNTTVISENNVNSLWNNDSSSNPNIFIDNTGKKHVVWSDETDGIWGNDSEIIYTSSTDGIIWSNATVISDGLTINGTYWNDGRSINPCIITDNSGRIYVVWEDETDGIWGNDTEIMYSSSADGIIWSNATVISDGYNSTYWNNGNSSYPSIATDDSNKIHVVWNDNSDGVWRFDGNDDEIMYVNYTEGVGWTNITIISDGYNGTYWNDAASTYPSIFVDNFEIAHIVWTDSTDGIWGGDGSDMEIMYATYLEGIGISNITVISDGYNDFYWNNDLSVFPSISINNTEGIHVVWQDHTNGSWGYDSEIMYASSMNGIWSNATVISDDATKWNSGESWFPTIAIDRFDNIKVAWGDHTDGIWGNDGEIMYASNSGSGWSNATVISDDGMNWNDGSSGGPSIAFDHSGNLHIVWEDSTDGIWGNDTEIMYIFISLESVHTPFDFLYMNIVLTLLILGAIGCLLLYEKNTTHKLRALKKKSLVDATNIFLSASVVSLQIIQINHNYENEIRSISDNLFVFIIPYFLLLIALLIVILFSISLVISLKEYKSFLKTKNVEPLSFRRISFDKVFENENRQHIIEKILNNSEIHYKELLRECNLTNGQLQWHLRVLLEYGVIKKRKVGQYNIFYPINDNFESKRYSNIIIKSETSLTILDLIEKTPGIIPSVIADKLHFKRSTINYHIKKLEKKKINKIY